MAKDRHHFKVGLFVVALATAAVSFLFWIGSTGVVSKETVPTAIYFDESVQGLSEGSEVKYRGFKIGEVSSLGVATDRKHLEVRCLVARDFLADLGELGGPDARVATKIVARLGSSGLTGLKFVEIDLPATPPVGRIELPEGVRTPDEVALVIPSTPSTLKSVEIALNEALDAVRMHGPNVGGIISGLNSFLAALNESGVTVEATTAIKNLGTRIDELDTKRLSEETSSVLEEVGTAVKMTSDSIGQLTDAEGDLRRMMRQIESSARVLTTEVQEARLAETTSSVRDGANRVGEGADRVGAAADAVAGAAVALSGIVGELELTLRSVRSTVDELRGLVFVLEQDPSSLLFGRQYRPAPAPEKPN